MWRVKAAHRSVQLVIVRIRNATMSHDDVFEWGDERQALGPLVFFFKSIANTMLLFFFNLIIKINVSLMHANYHVKYIIISLYSWSFKSYELILYH
jgi:hypothetical protein